MAQTNNQPKKTANKKNTSNTNYLSTRLAWGICVMSGMVLAAYLLPLGYHLLKPKLIRNTPFSSLSNLKKTTVLAAPQTSKNTLIYPKLGITTPVWTTTISDPMDIASWEELRSVLRKGVGVVADTSDISQAKRIYILGHSSDYNILNSYAMVFAPLYQANVGDTFSLTLDETYEYRVVDKKLLSPTDAASFASLTPASDSHVQRVILVTCWPVFTTQQRLLVIGERDLL